MKIRDKKIASAESACDACAINPNCISSVTAKVPNRCTEKIAEALFAIPFWIMGASAHSIKKHLSRVEGVLNAAVIFNASVVRVYYDSRRTAPSIIGRALSTTGRNKDNLFQLSFGRIHQADLHPVEEKKHEY